MLAIPYQYQNLSSVGISVHIKSFILYDIMNGVFLSRYLSKPPLSVVLHYIVKDRFLSIDQFSQYKPVTSDKKTAISCNKKNLCGPRADI